MTLNMKSLTNMILIFSLLIIQICSTTIPNNGMVLSSYFTGRAQKYIQLN